MDKPKRKSTQRFQQLNLLCDEVLRNLQSPSHALVLLVGWRHADERCTFRKSLSELAAITGLSKRQIQRLTDDLVHVGALKVVKPKQGTIPTRYLITGKPRVNAISVPNGASVDMGVHTKPKASVDIGVP